MHGGWSYAGAHVFQYYSMGGDPPVVLKSAYSADGTTRGVTLWLAGGVWTGDAGGVLRKVNSGTREQFISLPERHGLAPYYPMASARPDHLTLPTDRGILPPREEEGHSPGKEERSRGRSGHPLRRNKEDNDQF